MKKAAAPKPTADQTVIHELAHQMVNRAIQSGIVKTVDDANSLFVGLVIPLSVVKAEATGIDPIAVRREWAEALLNAADIDEKAAAPAATDTPQ